MGPDDSMSFPAVYGAKKVDCSCGCSLNSFYDVKKRRTLLVRLINYQSEICISGAQ